MTALQALQTLLAEAEAALAAGDTDSRLIETIARARAGLRESENDQD